MSELEVIVTITYTLPRKPISKLSQNVVGLYNKQLPPWQGTCWARPPRRRGTVRRYTNCTSLLKARPNWSSVSRIWQVYISRIIENKINCVGGPAAFTWYFSINLLWQNDVIALRASCSFAWFSVILKHGLLVVVSRKMVKIGRESNFEELLTTVKAGFDRSKVGFN